VPREDDVRLRDIEVAAQNIQSFVGGVTRAHFLANVEKQYAVLHALKIIGEAARLISDDTKERLSHVPWDEIRGMRNRLAHEYFAIDLHIVWDTVLRDMPILVRVSREDDTC